MKNVLEGRGIARIRDVKLRLVPDPPHVITSVCTVPTLVIGV